MIKVSVNCSDYMHWLGGFSPTNLPKNMELKGYMSDGYGDVDKTYIDSDGLRSLSNACLEMAAWLEQRSKEVDEPQS